MMDQNKVLCIVGPTASGKSALAVRLAKRLDGEVISADAVAVYRRLDIGSAKPTESERDGIPHHLIDCVDLENNSFSVSEFREMARNSIDDILDKGKYPIVVGGSGLYVDAVFSDMRFSAPADAEVRAKIDTDYDRDKTGVFDALKHVDPATASRLHPNDRKRVVRALEVFYVTGKAYSLLNEPFESAQESDGTYHVVRVGLSLSRDELYRRIDRRVERMVHAGLIEEAFALFRDGFTPDRYKAMQSIGYAQLYPVYTGEITLQDAVEQIKRDTRRFAKRQITWFKRNRSTVWFDMMDASENKLIDGVLELLK